MLEIITPMLLLEPTPPLPITETKLHLSLIGSRQREIIADNNNHNNSRDNRGINDVKMKIKKEMMDQMIMNPLTVLRIDYYHLYL